MLHTNIKDKWKILADETDFYKKLNFESKKKANRFFAKLTKVRNKVAHPDTLLEIFSNPDEFIEFFDKICEVSDNLNKLNI